MYFFHTEQKLNCASIQTLGTDQINFREGGGGD
jgi:hypothetical protein